MNYAHIVAVLAILQFFYFGILVGRARGKYAVHAPATSGHEGFDRIYRVQMNTLEQIVGFLPALLLASLYWPNAIIAGIGAVYLIGRFLYQRSYVTDPAKRGLGFLLTVLPTFVLLLAVVVGVVLAGGFFRSERPAQKEASAIVVPAPAVVATEAPVQTTSAPVLSATSYGKITFGDRLSDVEQRLGEKAPPIDVSEEESCRYAQFKAYPGVNFMVEDGVVTRLDSGEPVVTSIGFTVGASMAEMKKKIPTAIIEPNHYDPAYHYITMMSEDGKTALLFDENEGSVLGVRAGLVPSVQYIEGCL